jgi:adenylate cyclase
MRRFNRECERKFLIRELPIDLCDFIKQEVSQCYLIANKLFCIRLRKYNDGRKYLDFKFGHGEIKFKIGFSINFWINKKCLCKTRYKKHINNVLMIIDVFTNGLKIVEIESKSHKAIKYFEIPEWFGEEVTHNPKYRNRYLYFNI